MGCVQSRRDCSDIHPNVFRVINIDERGTGLWSGQLEVTETEIVLYREGRDATVWPLKCLRRYGYDDEIFSFESGRRCTTGQGIYAFKCRRANELFGTLQQNINGRNVGNDPSAFSGHDLIQLRPPTLSRPPIMSSTNTNIPNHNIGDLPMLSQTNSMNITRNLTSSPSGDILEVTTFNSIPDSSQTHVTNLYQIENFRARESNNNLSENSVAHSYCNDLNQELAALRNSLRSETALNTLKDIEDENHFFRSKINNVEIRSPSLSPTVSSTSEHYAALSSDEDRNLHPYMNIHAFDGRGHSNEGNERIEHRVVAKPSLSTLLEEAGSYANVGAGDPTLLKLSPLNCGRIPSESDTILSLSPIEDMAVNYAVLDIENSDKGRIEKNGTPENINLGLKPRVSLQKFADTAERSPPKMLLGYTTIDFNKTEALESVVTGTDIEIDESTRRTRHDSIALPPLSP